MMQSAAAILVRNCVSSNAGYISETQSVNRQKTVTDSRAFDLDTFWTISWFCKPEIVQNLCYLRNLVMKSAKLCHCCVKLVSNGSDWIQISDFRSVCCLRIKSSALWRQWSIVGLRRKFKPVELFFGQFGNRILSVQLEFNSDHVKQVRHI